MQRRYPTYSDFYFFLVTQDLRIWTLVNNNHERYCDCESHGLLYAKPYHSMILLLSWPITMFDQEPTISLSASKPNEYFPIQKLKCMGVRFKYNTSPFPWYLNGKIKSCNICFPRCCSTRGYKSKASRHLTQWKLWTHKFAWNHFKFSTRILFLNKSFQVGVLISLTTASTVVVW